MMSPDAYLSEYENANYLDLLKLKNELVQCITDFETDYDKEDAGWGCISSPDVHYQWNLEVLGKVCCLLKEAFNREYEWGDKDISDYYEDMKKKDL